MQTSEKLNLSHLHYSYNKTTDILRTSSRISLYSLFLYFVTMFPVLLNLFSIVFVNVVLKEAILLYYITKVLSQKSFTAIISESITLLSTLF